MSAWTDFVTKIYNEEHNKNSNYQYKQAMKDASKRKGEMESSSTKTNKKQRKTKKSGGSKKQRKSKKSRKNRK